MLELLAAIGILLVASALCSGTEAAIFSLPLSKARQLAENGSLGRLVCSIRENPARAISALVIFNNIANIVGTYIVARMATSALSEEWQTWLPFVLTALVILVSEILPKAIGERYCARVVSIFAYPIWVTTIVLSPLVWLVELFLRLFVPGTTRTITTSESEIRALVKIGQQEGVIEVDESRLLARVFELNDKRAVDIMTPRTALTWLPAQSTLKESKLRIATSQHSRIVVTGETIDDPKGIVLKSKVLEVLVTGEDEEIILESLIEPVATFPEEAQADNLLEHFQNSHSHLAFVMDEYGGLAGIVTLEDVLEVLTGEIVDETDVCEDMQQIALTYAKSKLSNGILFEKKQAAVG